MNDTTPKQRRVGQPFKPTISVPRDASDSVVSVGTNITARYSESLVVILLFVCKQLHRRNVHELCLWFHLLETSNSLCVASRHFGECHNSDRNMDSSGQYVSFLDKFIENIYDKKMGQLSGLSKRIQELKAENRRLKEEHRKLEDENRELKATKKRLEKIKECE